MKAFEEQIPKESILELFNQQNKIKALNISPIHVLEEMANENQTGKSNNYTMHVSEKC